MWRWLLSALAGCGLGLALGHAFGWSAGWSIAIGMLLCAALFAFTAARVYLAQRAVLRAMMAEDAPGARGERRRRTWRTASGRWARRRSSPGGRPRARSRCARRWGCRAPP